MMGELHETRITRLCERLSVRVKKIADALERALDESPPKEEEE